MLLCFDRSSSGGGCVAALQNNDKMHDDVSVDDGAYSACMLQVLQGLGDVPHSQGVPVAHNVRSIVECPPITMHASYTSR